ncbi:MAG: isoprenyl transferase [Firmicutes bacterium]|nr:isoprenyl transferase [Bacillota bacterium]
MATSICNYKRDYIMTELIKERMPKHVAIIMDGNGRWAKKRGVPRLAGHRAGMEAMKKAVNHSDALGIKYLTVYAFSTENWKRSMEEVSGIFKLLVTFVNRDLRELIDNNVKVKVLGDYSSIPDASLKALEKTIEDTKDNTGLQFNIALNYGGRDEIRRAVEAIGERCANGEIAPEDITEELIGSYMWTGSEHADAPDPELIIRTSGEYRLSNFLLWQSAYSEFVFSDVLWPDFTDEEYDRCIADYQSRERRFGGR